ncbi:MAG: hypothetical protein KC925_00650 [Candidatus Doudnabacteria bacterium]|nr:hypothetical protein [Candidatus Doudnabacteria bacterium]
MKVDVSSIDSTKYLADGYSEIVEMFGFGLTEAESIAMGFADKDIQNRLFRRRPNRLGAAIFALGRVDRERLSSAQRLIDLIQGFCDIADWIIDDRDTYQTSSQSGRVKVVHSFLYGLSGCREFRSEDIRKLATHIRVSEKFLANLYESSQRAHKKLQLKPEVRREICVVLDKYIASQEVTVAPSGDRLDLIRKFSEEKKLQDIDLVELFFSWNTPLYAYFLIGVEVMRSAEMIELRKVYSALSAVNIALDSMLRVKRDIYCDDNNLLFVYLGKCEAKYNASGMTCDHILQGVGRVVAWGWEEVEKYESSLVGKMRGDADFHRFVLRLMTEKHYARLIDRADVKFERELSHV